MSEQKLLDQLIHKITKEGFGLLVGTSSYEGCKWFVAEVLQLKNIPKILTQVSDKEYIINDLQNFKLYKINGAKGLEITVIISIDPTTVVYQGMDNTLTKTRRYIKFSSYFNRGCLVTDEENGLYGSV